MLSKETFRVYHAGISLTIFIVSDPLPSSPKSAILFDFRVFSPADLGEVPDRAEGVEITAFP